MKKTLAEQIKDLEATRAAKAARMSEVMQKSIDEGRSTDEAESEEFDTLETEVKQIDADLVRLRKLESLAVAQGTRIVNKGTDDPDPARSGSDQRGPTIVVASKEAEPKFPGQMYTRLVIAKAVARLLDAHPAEIAQQRWGKTNPLLVQWIRATVAGGGTGSGEWGSELVGIDNRYTGDFIEFLNAMTVFFRLPLREVPANVAIKGQDGAATGYWVGESKAIPVSKPDFSNVELTALQVAALAVVSNKLLRESSPSAEMLVRDALVEACAQRVDTTFLSTAAAVAGVSPAGILNGLSAISSSGNDAENVRADLAALYAGFITAKNAKGLALVMNPALAKAIQLMTTSLGLKSFTGITQNGGELEGDPVYTGDNVNAAHLILLKPSDIWRIGDQGVEVSISREAMIEQNDSPTGASDTPAAATATPVSMFQTDSTAIKVVRPLNFAKRRTSAVAYIDDAAYSVIESP